MIELILHFIVNKVSDLSIKADRRFAFQFISFNQIICFRYLNWHFRISFSNQSTGYAKNSKPALYQRFFLIFFMEQGFSSLKKTKSLVPSCSITWVFVLTSRLKKPMPVVDRVVAFC